NLKYSMDEIKNEEKNIPVTSEELKMPTEEFRSTVEETVQQSHTLIYILVGILILLLVALGSLVLWRNEIVNIFNA
ncbi:MAG: hypothetical protein WDZ68_01875, partial [Candidatus Paceibacterota bacterium]